MQESSIAVSDFSSIEDSALSNLLDLGSMADELALPDLITAFFELSPMRLDLESEIEKMKLLDEVNISAEHINRLEISMSRHEEQIQIARRRNKTSKMKPLDEFNISAKHIDRLKNRMIDEEVNKHRRRQQIARRRTRNSTTSDI